MLQPFAPCLGSKAPEKLEIPKKKITNGGFPPLPGKRWSPPFKREVRKASSVTQVGAGLKRGIICDHSFPGRVDHQGLKAYLKLMDNPHSLKLTVSRLKLLGRRPIFRGKLAVSFKEGYPKWCLSSNRQSIYKNLSIPSIHPISLIYDPLGCPWYLVFSVVSWFIIPTSRF